jgi:L-ascorbate metabolism protein UlaG (beta-lactamase superfamily)
MSASACWLGHATVLIEMGGQRILTDPILVNRIAFLTRVAAAPAPADSQGIDLVLISHLHLDHLERRSLARIGTDVPLIIGTGGGDLVRRWGWTNVTEVDPGERLRLGEIELTATPANHAPERSALGPRGTAVGYLLETDRERVYFAGDTDLFEEMATLAHDGLDLALLPIAGWGPRLGPGHLNPSRATEAVGQLGARAVVPIHWGTLWPAGLSLVSRKQLVAPAAEFAAQMAEREPSIRSIVAQPGDRIPFG